MARIYLCFLWHMHQPFYKDLLSGEYRLPWTRMHALKDYYGMVRILDEFPEVRQTFNLVPSMMVQIEEYATGQAADPFLRCALKPAEELSDDEKRFILRYFFQANPGRLIYRYPRYGELYDAWLATNQKPERALIQFDAQSFRDLQVLSQLAWFDEYFQATHPEVRDLLTKARGFSISEQERMGKLQFEVLRQVLPVYRELSSRGQIEVSTTPFYHPILPLLCDSSIADVAHAGVPLPARFQYPQDAKRQLQMARQFMTEKLGCTPSGLWPSEGSVSDDALRIAAECGFSWAASDNGVLSRTLHRDAPPEVSYQPWVWRQGEREISLLFRDHLISDLVGFVYSRMSAGDAAADFHARIHDNCRSILHSGRDAVVPVFLDGENAWEYYAENGRPFLRELYRRVSQDPCIEAVTISEALSRVEPARLHGIFPGSWINANFDVWIGAEEDNLAWESLLRARQTFERVVSSDQGTQLSEEQKLLAWEELLIAEGSDWCWWYGPEHDSANRPEFDQLYRDHLANVYRALGLAPHEELSRPILRLPVAEYHAPPSAWIHPSIDGDGVSYFKWMGAGRYRVDERFGAMHGQRSLIRDLYYGNDERFLYLRIDFEHDIRNVSEDLAVRLAVSAAGDDLRQTRGTVCLRAGEIVSGEFQFAAQTTAGEGWEFAFHRILEGRLDLSALGIRTGESLFLQLSVWQGGLPMDSLPPQGWLKFSTEDPAWGN